MLVIVEPFEAVELPGVVVHGHPIIHEVHCSHLTQLWNFFMNCGGIIKGLRLKSYRVCTIFNVSPMRVCKKSMHGCIG
jgi:hypothetical protein